MIREIKGKAPRSSERKQVGNADCVLNPHAENIIPIVEDHVHAIRCYDAITLPLQRNTIYVDCIGEIPVNVMNEHNINVLNGLPEMYEGMAEHLGRPESETELYCMSHMTIVHNSSGEPASVAKINGHVIGYYLPGLNTWLATNWTWHIHYMTIVLSYVWPKLVEAFGIQPCDNSLSAEKRLGPTANRIEVTIGCDPEFETMRNGVIIRADNVVTRDNAVSPTTELGLDGSCAQVEVRPKPSKNPGKVVKNIRDILKKFASQYGNIDLTDSGNHYPLGGHIHVGVGQPIELDRELCMILDDFIGRPTLNLSGSARENYKQLGAHRSQPHGFEYRSPPAAVYQNPQIAYIVFKLAKNLSERYFNQETIKYDDRPTIQDYMQVGGLTEKQATYFMKFINEYKPEKSIRSSWKVEPALVNTNFRSNVTIEFHDEWSPETTAYLMEEITASVNPSLPVTVSFYGLNSDRGSDICTIPVDGFVGMPNDRLPKAHWDGNVLNIGVSRNRRLDMGTSRKRLLVNAVVMCIKSYVVMCGGHL
jgi:hypothetical protein